VIFESPRRVGRLLTELSERGLGERRCVLCRELTKLHEQVADGSVAELAEGTAGESLRGEVTLVLEGGERPGWEERRGEVESAARRLVEEGLSTRDVVERLQRSFGVPRNEAYELALTCAARGEDG